MKGLTRAAVHLLHLASLALVITMSTYAGMRLAYYIGHHASAEDQDARRCREREGLPVFGWHGMLSDCRPLPRGGR
jgi:hypothetical protein